MGHGTVARVRHAGWWRRVSAAFFDVLLGLPFIVPGVVALFIGPTERTSCTGFDGVVAACDVPTGGTIAVASVLSVAGLLVYFVIYVRLLGRGATWGRGALGYRVLDERTLQPIGTGRAIGRNFAAILERVAVLPRLPVATVGQREPDVPGHDRADASDSDVDPSLQEASHHKCCDHK